jgi:hypothetical protein
MKSIGVVTLCLLCLIPIFRAANSVIPKDIKPLKGTAPYGVEKRPMPDGLVMDELLPKQVGPYTRMSLEKSEHRGVIPTKVEVNGESIYAVYKVGPKEVFVEFSVSTSPQTAQETLAVAARNTTGKFPKDPRVGSISTEPSYLKANTKSGAFFGWTRGKYYFSASAKGGEADLDAFMEGFPY